jgi:alanine racemase
MFAETAAATPIASPHAHAVVDLDAMAHNTSLFVGGTSAEVMAVVKADGFGHGALPVAATALASGATWLGVTTCAEALHLRDGGVTAPILSWMHSPAEDFGPALLADVDLSVSSPDHLRAVAANAARLGVTATVHLRLAGQLPPGTTNADRRPVLADAHRLLDRLGSIPAYLLDERQPRWSSTSGCFPRESATP